MNTGTIQTKRDAFSAAVASHEQARQSAANLARAWARRPFRAVAA